MKKLFAVLALVMLTGCEPIDTSTPEPDRSAAPAASSDNLSAVEKKYDSPELRFKPVQVNKNTTIIHSTSSNQVLVKRITDDVGTCWVLQNTKNWDTSISCVRNPKQNVNTDEVDDFPEDYVPE